MQADIGFEDESGIGIMTRYGKTWGLRGETPVIPSSMKRGGYNVISVVTAEGKMQYSIKYTTIKSEVFIEFMKRLIEKRERPLIMLVDHASFHHSKAVSKFVGQHRSTLRIFFLPRHVPEMNPDEQVWNEIKTHQIGKQPISFFELTDTHYAAQTE